MLRRVSTLCAFLTLILPFVTAHWSRRHQEVAHRARGDVDIYKRQYYSGARFTYYDVGLGACGQYSSPSDWIVALNVAQYGSGYPGPQCFKPITIQYGGKTAQAVIMDECMGCPVGGLDFSQGLFEYFASTSAGVLYGEWWYDDDSGGGGDQTSSTWAPSSTTWEPPTTSTPDYTPTTSSTPAYTPPPTTSSTPAYTPPPTTSSTSSTSSINSGTGWTSGSAFPTEGATPDTNNPQNILVINSVLVKFGILLTVAEETE